MMVHLEAGIAARWIYVKASGFLDYWEDACDVLYKDAIEEARRLSLGAILYDARSLCAEFGPWKVVGNHYLLRQKLGGIRLAHVTSDAFVGLNNYAEQVAERLDVPVKAFVSLKEASRWLEKNIGDQSPLYTGAVVSRRSMRDVGKKGTRFLTNGPLGSGGGNSLP